MNSYRKLFFVALLSIGLFGAGISTSCKKDRSMEAILYVKLMSDTLERVPDARVVMSRGDVEVIGYTNQNGEFRHTFELPIQLDIVVTKDSLKGLGIINLGNPGTDVKKYIYLF